MLLFFLAQAELLHDGRHHDATATASTALRIAEGTGQHQWVIHLKSVLAYLSAVQGDERRFRELTADALSGTVPMRGALWVD